METRNYWEENGHVIKYDNYTGDAYDRAGAAEPANYAAPGSEDEGDYSPNYLKKGKVSRQDPMSHRIIEKRRRDRMNNCLADLSRLIPPEYLKKGRGRVEKTEIIEMAIRHLKYLQERANAQRQMWGDQFKAGYQEAAAETIRYLEDQGYPSADPLTSSLAAHLQRHCDLVIKGEPNIVPKEMRMVSSHIGSSSETASSSSSSLGYPKPGVIAQAPPAYIQETYEPERNQDHYLMDCDQVTVAQLPLTTEGEAPPSETEPLALDGRRKREPTLRAIRKPDREDFLHSYKFKNCIERRFSKSQDSEAAEVLARAAHAHKSYAHKRRRPVVKPASTSTSTCNSTSTSGSNSGSNSGSTEDASPQDTSSESPHQHYEAPATQYVPVFALHALGKYYVPLSVEAACVARQLAGGGAPAPGGAPARPGGAPAAPGGAPARPAPPPALHPVTIHVNFQPCRDHHLKREPADDWRPA